MLRTPSTLSARTLTRNLRSRRLERRPSPVSKLRLDTLEAREQPGSVMSGLAAGLAGGGMLEPLAIMAAVIGPDALAAPTTPSGGGTARADAAGLTISSAPPARDAAPARPATASDATEGTGSIPPAAAAPAVEIGDLSIGDPGAFSLPAGEPAASGGTGGSAGGDGGIASSALAGQSTATDTTPTAGHGGAEGDSGLSVTQPSPHATGPAPKPSAAPAAGAPAGIRAAETFVTPPSDAPALEGPAPTQRRTATLQTTTNPLFAVGTDAGVTAQVKVYDAQTRALKYTLSPFPNSFTGGARVAVADVTGDGTSDVVVGEGPGGTNLVRVYDGSNGHVLHGTLGSFSPFTTAQANGVWVAADDVTGDGKADLVVGTDGTFAPQVKVFSGANGNLVRTQDVSKLGLVGGVRVAAGDLNGDGRAEVVVGGGPGGPARVAAFDGATGMELYDYQPFDPGYAGGVTLAAGDVTGDGVVDVVAGPAAGGALVKVFSGADTASTVNLDAFPGTTGGARVGVADANGDGIVDLLAARGPGAGEARGYTVADGGQVFALTPFGATYTGGTFVAGDPRPVAVVHQLTVTPTVTISVDKAAVGEDGGSLSVTISRDDTSTSLGVNITYGGTAVQGVDFAGTSAVALAVGQASQVFQVVIDPDGVFEPGGETVVISVAAGTGYTVGDPSSATTLITDDDADGVLPLAGIECGTDNAGMGAWDGDPFFSQEGGSDQSNDNFFDQPSGPDPSNDDFYQFQLCCECLFGAGGFGAPQSPTGSRDPNPDPAAPSPGTDWGVGAVPSLQTDGSVVLLRSAGQAAYFDPSGGGYVPRDYSQDTLTHASGSGSGSGAGGTFTLTTPTGAQVVFNDFSTSLPTNQRGQVISMTDPAGNALAVTSRAADGKPTEMQRTSTTGGVTTTESFLLAYVASGTNAGKLASLTLRRKVGAGSWTTVRSAEFTQYDTGSSLGNAGDLKTAVVKDGNGNVLSTAYHRYYTSTGSGGYAGAVKYKISGAAYDRFAAWCAANATTVDGATGAQLSAFADDYFEYDSVGRVTLHTQQGTGCSVCSGGMGTSTFAYTTSRFGNGYNSWRTKAVETQADGNTVTLYTNFVGEPMLGVYHDATTGQSWETYRKYDAVGRTVLRALPSAVSGYDDTYADLLNNQSGNYQYLRDSQGLIETAAYGTSTTATSSTAGSVLGYLSQTKVQRGETGTGILQRSVDYVSRTGGSITIFPVADVTQYRNTDGTGGQTTSLAYTFATGTIRPTQIAVTLPAVTTGENGPGTATSATVALDSRGRVIWEKDPGGFLTYVAYDDVTGGVTKVIEDVDTTQTSTFANLPSGWSTPTGGGLHLTTTYEVDALGRTTKETSPAGNVTYTVYNDPGREIRVYPGWDSTNNVPTGPTQVYREDWSNGYTETFTMSATPTTSGGRPTGAESISNVQSLSRNVLNDAGQVVDQDEYISLSGTSYSASSVTLGTSGTNYNRTQLAYDHLGRLNRIVTPTGTIYRKVTDGQGRLVSEWVGTDDTPTSGFWSPTNTAGTDLVNTDENEYDSGGVGDGLLTKTTEHPGGSAADRVTAVSYDWRDRPVAEKDGAETTESTSVNRPIMYLVFDNLDEVTEADQYDGDGLSITTDADTDGVPDQPSASALRAKSAAAYDELGQVSQEKTFSVDPSSGSVSSNALTTNHWFDSRGNEIKTSLPGGEVDKAAFDGAGRPTVQYMTDGGGDSAYADAATVTGDAVLEQVESTYDADGNTILTATRERFHDETTTGALGNPTTAPKARVSYQAGYFDKADRLTDAVDAGTNGGNAYTRPGTVPTRSDTVLVTSYGYNAAGWAESVTDPMGLLGKTFYDLAGRTLKTVENYVDGTVSDADDKTVELTFNGNGQNVNTSADLTGGGQQTTANVYGVSTGSDLVSNDLVAAVEYPDPSTGSPSSSSEDTYTYNRLGQVKTKTDRNGTVHTYTYDVLGRVVSDAITTLGTGVDGAVRRIETAYDGQGNAYLITSYDAASGGNVVNQVQREFNGLGQLTTEWQATSGSVNTSTSPKVQYAYSFAPSGSTNHSRLTSITYPNGRVITYNYASGLSDTISRLSSITDGATTLESYDYLGQGTVVRRGHPQTGIDLTYEKLTGESNGDAGDQYTGLDRFGQVDDQRWTTSAGTAADRRQYGYDRDSNRLYADNLVSTSNSELYAYDGLNELTSFQRGTLNGTKDGLIGSASRSQSWDFDAVGNFDSQTTDGTAQTRTANKQNEITSISGATTPTYDANGNTTGDQAGKQFVYDAWNRLVVVKNSGGTTLATYQYDALGRRARETRGSTTTDLYYSSAWQVLEERVGGAVQSSYVWSPVYVDALIARDRDADGNSANGLEERLYALQDTNFNVVGLVNSSGSVVERYQYDAYGTFTVLDGSWGSRTATNYGWTYLFQGGRWDPDGGVYSFRNREFSPALARWVQNDPTGFSSGDTNYYRVYFGNPTRWNDPSGFGPPPADGPPVRIGPSVTGPHPWVTARGPGWQGFNNGWTWRAPDGTVWNWDENGNHWDVHQGGQAGRGTGHVRIDRNGGLWRHSGPRRGGGPRREGSINGGALKGLAAGQIATILATWGYEQYLGAGQECGEKLAKRVGICRALQILGVAGELPDGYTFDLPSGVGDPTIHVILVLKDGQWYFTAWHTEHHTGYIGPGYDEPVDDVRLGDCPAYHTPNAPTPPPDVSGEANGRMGNLGTVTAPPLPPPPR